MRELRAERSLRVIKEVLTHKKNIRWQGICDVESFIPPMDWIYFDVGGGLVMYEPIEGDVMLHAAVINMPLKPVSTLLNNFKQVAELGYENVWAYIEHGHQRACVMAKAAGFERQDFNYGNLFKRGLLDG